MTDFTPAPHTFHPRQYQGNRFVYPVLSRRSQGISLGVNLNPDKICNFDCVYCQVDRRSAAETKFVDLPQVLQELDLLLQMTLNGTLYDDPRFARIPENLRRLNDIAFSGDGEPTTYRNFDDIVTQVAALKKRHGLDETKLVLITNASMFHRETVQRGLEVLDQNNGEVWAKLDAGTEAYYREIERTPIPFQQILDNILDAARVRPLVIQSLFLKLNGVPPSRDEITAFCTRLNEIQAAGGQLKLVQVYTVARTPAEAFVSSLEDHQVDEITERVRTETGIPAESYYK